MFSDAVLQTQLFENFNQHASRKRENLLKKTMAVLKLFHGQEQTTDEISRSSAYSRLAHFLS